MSSQHAHHAHAGPPAAYDVVVSLIKRRGKKGPFAYRLTRRRPAPDPFGALIAEVEAEGGPITDEEKAAARARYESA
ncbi:hypothetical protein [Streptomyces sp. SYSU K217416]